MILLPVHEVAHVVLTNLSAPLHAEDPPLTAEEVWYRLGFFLDACRPSVLSQEGASFTWLVWFDDRCDGDIVAEVARLADGAFVPVWGRPFDLPSVADEVDRHAAAALLATTQVPFDAAIARGCLASIQAEARDATLLVSFPEGLSIDRTGGVFTADRSPVHSLVEPRDGDRPPVTVVGADTLGPDLPRVTVRGRQWIDVIHEAGRDDLRGRRVDPRLVAERFDIDLAYDRDPSGGRSFKARAADWRRWGENHVTRAPRADRLLRPALRGVRSVRWRANAAVNEASEGVHRRLTGTGLRPVAGDPAAVVGGDRVAVLAEYHTGPEVRPWALRMAGELASAGYPCLIVCSRDGAKRVDAPADLPSGVAVVARGNVRLDFGAWAAALESFPDITKARHVLLTNDSIVGPLEAGHPGVRALLERGESLGTGVFAATRGLTGSDHLQSYWLHFTDTVGDPAVRAFFSDLPRTRDRTDLIHRYEHGLSRLLRERGIRTGWAWEAASFGYGPETNPYLCWQDLLEAGFPFVKRRILTHPRFAPVRPLVLQYAREHFDVDLSTGL